MTQEQTKYACALMRLLRSGIALILLSPFLLGAAPSRTQTYTAGTIIDPADVTENEDNIFQYLQAGVDTYRSGTVDSTAIANGTIVNADISSSAAIDYSKLSLSSSILTGDVVDNTLTTSDLNATLTFSDGDLVDLSSINTSSSTEGLKLPQNTACTSGTAEGQICWDTNDDLLYVGDGAAAKLVGAYAVPSLTLGTANAAGSANTGIRTDATILAFDATLPAALGTAATGAATVAARRDHVHQAPAFEAGMTNETVNDNANGTDVSLTLDVQSKVIVMLTGNCSAYGGAGATNVRLRRDAGDLEVRLNELSAVGDDLTVFYYETLAAGTYAWDVAVDSVGGTSTLDYELVVFSVPNT